MLNRLLSVFVLFVITSLFNVSAAPPSLTEIENDQQRADKFVTPKVEEKPLVDGLQLDESVKNKGESKVANSLQFVLQGIKIQGNESLEQSHIIDIAKPYVGQAITGQDLKDIAEKITRLYHQNGYQTSRCVIPAQQVQSGNVVLQIEENKLNNIRLSGEKSYQYEQKIFLRYLKDLQGKIIHADTLIERLRKLSFLPATRITPVLQNAGFGKTDLILQLSEIQETKTVALYNNASRLTGDYRLNANAVFVNLTGIGDYLTVGASIEPQQTELFSSYTARYVLPYGNDGARMSMRLTSMDYQLEDITGGSISVKGGSKLLDFTYQQPFTFWDATHFASIGFEYKSSYLENNFNIVGTESFQVDSEDDCTAPNGAYLNQNNLLVCDRLSAPISPAGQALFDNEEQFFMFNLGINGQYSQDAFGLNHVLNYDVTFKHSLEGVLGSSTQQDYDNKRKNTEWGIPQSGEPIGLVSGVDASFWKLYTHINLQSIFNEEWSLLFDIYSEYTNKKAIANSYRYGSADSGVNGNRFDLAVLYKPIEHVSAKLGYYYDISEVYIFESETSLQNGVINQPNCGGAYNIVADRFYSCSIDSPYLAIAYDNGRHLASLQYRASVESFESRKDNLSLSYAYRF